MKKLLVITGGTKGIGKAVAFKFAESGEFDVVNCSSTQESLDDFQNSFSEKFPQSQLYLIKSDLSRKEDVKLFCEEILKLKRPVDVLLNNAGLFFPGSVMEEEEGVFEKLVSLNLESAYHITRALGRNMITRKSGHIFNMCSTASITPYINGGSYCITKYALYGMTKVLREEMKEHNIRVTAILPGATYTNSWKGAGIEEERFMKPEDVAEVVFSSYNLSKQSVVEEVVVRPQLGDI